MKIGIVGSGAIGLYYGTRLLQADEDVRFLVRSDFEAAREQGVRIKTQDGSEVFEVSAYRESSEIGVCDVVLVSLKTTGNDALPALLDPLVGERTVLVTLQNGLGNDDYLKELYPQNDVVGCLCFICLNRIAPAVVENYHPGSVGIGPHGDTDYSVAERVAGLFEKAGIVTRKNRDLGYLQWRKLVWNIPFNGLAIAGGGITTDKILECEALKEEARALMLEIIRAANGFAYPIKDDFANRQIEQTGEMGAYKPSSMIDFANGNAVELEAIWGEPLRRAQELGLAMPKLELLYALLKRLCASRD